MSDENLRRSLSAAADRHEPAPGIHERILSAGRNNAHRNRRLKLAGFAGTAGIAALLIIGVSLIPPTEKPNPNDGSGNATQPPDSPSTDPGPITLKFDDRGGGSKTIRVYAGPAETEADRVSTGSYQSGQTITAQCRVTGRDVTADTSVGESPGRSSTWIRIDASSPQPQFASLVYATLLDTSGQAVSETGLPAC